MPVKESGTLAERYWRRVVKGSDPDSCWGWTGATHKFGYGCLMNEGKVEGAHRVSWMLHHGAIPYRLHVLHRCDNPPCTNPRHLFLGTQRHNNLDMHRKGRGHVLGPSGKGGSSPGETNPAHKLTWAQVREIRAVYTGRRGEVSALSRRYGVSRPVISGIVEGRTWKEPIGGN